jgi:hypothetical protein
MPKDTNGMNLYLVYVKSSVDPLTGVTSKSVASIRVAVGKNPLDNSELNDIRKMLIGDQIALWVRAEDSSEIESRIIESGFKSSFDFISNYSKIV